MGNLPDCITIRWHYEDVKSVAEDLTDDECRRVLYLADKYHDCNYGICWDTIKIYADQVREERS